MLFPQIHSVTYHSHNFSPVAQWKKKSACDSEAKGSIPSSERSPRGGHGYPLHYSWLENPMDRGTWQATVPRVTKSWKQLKWLGMHAHGFCHILRSKETFNCYIPIRLGLKKNLTVPDASEKHGATGTFLYIIGKDAKWYSHLKKSLAACLKVKHKST